MRQKGSPHATTGPAAMYKAKASKSPLCLLYQQQELYGTYDADGLGSLRLALFFDVLKKNKSPRIITLSRDARYVRKENTSHGRGAAKIF